MYRILSARGVLVRYGGTIFPAFSSCWGLFSSVATTFLYCGAPAEAEEDAASRTSLPMKAGEEFKPFIRRLPEFKFWYQAQRAVVMATGATFFQASAACCIYRLFRPASAFVDVRDNAIVDWCGPAINPI